MVFRPSGLEVRLNLRSDFGLILLEDLTLGNFNSYFRWASFKKLHLVFNTLQNYPDLFLVVCSARLNGTHSERQRGKIR